MDFGFKVVPKGDRCTIGCPEAYGCESSERTQWSEFQEAGLSRKSLMSAAQGPELAPRHGCPVCRHTDSRGRRLPVRSRLRLVS